MRRKPGFGVTEEIASDGSPYGEPTGRDLPQKLGEVFAELEVNCFHGRIS